MKPRKGGHSRLRNLKQIIHQYFNDEDWKAFRSEDELREGKTEEMYQHILNKITEKEEQREDRKLKILKLAKYVSAASIVMLVGLGLWLSYRSNNEEVQQQYLQVNSHVNGETRNSKPIWKIVKNNQGTLRTVRLPDSSLALVYPQSQIKFETEFKGALRTVYLNGKARFKVKKNPKRPFSVYAGGLKTTALGTSFTINTLERKHFVTVKLHTGKIRVTQVNTNKAPAYISSVGTVLTYDSAQQLSKIIKATEGVVQPTTLLSRKGSLITMKNIPLRKVINLLNEAYGLHINADEMAIKKITYTGQVDVQKENAEQVLSDICLINNMTLIKISAQEFTIQKSNP
jgi:hypothetical protein